MLELSVKNLAAVAKRLNPIRQFALSSPLTILTDNKNLLVSPEEEVLRRVAALEIE
ncbi:hypothetical protein ACUNIY_12820 [Serratia sp. IR-2025]|uniref:hypothetical protein n=1 Tax=Serratia marcescens TaxID=615 RepID=UPI003879DEDE